MQRYTVTLVSPGTPGVRPTLLVPFEPSAIVTALIEELFKRVARQGIALAPNTYITTVHVDSEGGAIIDCEDVLSDVIPNLDKEKLFTVFTANQTAMTIQPTPQQVHMQIEYRHASGCANLGSSTVKQLHELVAKHVEVTATFGDKDDTNECNCHLARQLTDAASPPSHYTLVRGKSQVERIELTEPTEDGIKASLRQHLGQYFESSKKLQFFGAEYQVDDTSRYKKSAVVAICSKLRHVPAHACTVEGEHEETAPSRAHVLDLHTREIPIHSGCMEATLEQAGLRELAVDGIVDIFAVAV